MSTDSIFEERLIRKVIWRLVPFMIVCYIFNYLDRINVGMAKLKMVEELGLSETVFGIGVGVFFIGYAAFEVPSNIMLHRLGARVWIARIMVSWGLVSILFMFTKGEWSFYAFRLLLGIAEAGFFPGMLLYLTYWIPARHRARVGAIFMTSITLSGIIGAPLSGQIMKHFNHTLGLTGWQWMFLLEGIPTVLLGFSVLFIFTDRPRDARWLTVEERTWLTERIESEQRSVELEHGLGGMRAAFFSRHVWLLTVIYMSLITGFYQLNYWIPSILKDCVNAYRGDASDATIGLLTAIPFFGAMCAMVVAGKISDRFDLGRQFVAGGMVVGALSLLALSQSTSLAATLAALTCGAMGIFGTLASFWTLPSKSLHGMAEAAGLAFINSWGNLVGGYGSSQLMGAIKDRTGSYWWGFIVVACVLAVGVFLTLFLGRFERKAAGGNVPLALAD